jgi:RNA polymerase sigma-70 factor (ECF subfamily)
VLRAAEREVAREAVGRLPHDQRTAIVLTFWGDMTAQETAVAEDIPLGTAKSRVRLGLRRLAADPALAA